VYLVVNPTSVRSFHTLAVALIAVRADRTSKLYAAWDYAQLSTFLATDLSVNYADDAMVSAVMNLIRLGDNPIQALYSGFVAQTQRCTTLVKELTKIATKGFSPLKILLDVKPKDENG
jgi:hypothetical protein